MISGVQTIKTENVQPTSSLFVILMSRIVLEIGESGVVFLLIIELNNFQFSNFVGHRYNGGLTPIL